MYVPTSFLVILGQKKSPEYKSELLSNDKILSLNIWIMYLQLSVKFNRLVWFQMDKTGRFLR